MKSLWAVGTRFIASNLHQPKPGNAVEGRVIRRGEGGDERLGGPLWSPAVPPSVSRRCDWGGARRPTRATIKALPATLAPTDVDGLFVRLMRIGPDLSRPRGGATRSGTTDCPTRKGYDVGNPYIVFYSAMGSNLTPPLSRFSSKRLGWCNAHSK